MTIITDKHEKCRRIEWLIKDGFGVCESCREIGVSEKTFYRWRTAQKQLAQTQAEQQAA